MWLNLQKIQWNDVLQSAEKTMRKEKLSNVSICQKEKRIQSERYQQKFHETNSQNVCEETIMVVHVHEQHIWIVVTHTVTKNSNCEHPRGDLIY